MARVLLDTNICIYLIVRHPPEVMARFAAHRRGEVLISAVTWGELCAGAARNDGLAALQGLRSVLEVADFDAAAGLQYGELTRQHPGRKQAFDRMIAAHALALDVPLITNNTADFTRYEASGLRIANWVADASH